MRNNTKKDYFDLVKQRYEICLAPGETCSEKAINAHSVQNARTLDLLVKDGHVVMPSMPHENGLPVVRFELISRHKATTFSGLCGDHDREIFRAIDTRDLDPNSPEQLFLLAYRSVLRELHAVSQGAIKIQTAFQALVNSGKVRGDVPTPAGRLATQHIANAYDSYLYKRKFDEALLGTTFDAVEHTILRYENLLPTVAASALFSLDDIDWPDDVARVALNIFPDSQGTNVIFSYLAEERPFAMQYLGRILDASEDYQQYLISKLLLQHCENFVLAPEYYDKWSEEKKQAILDFFIHTLGNNDHAYENQYLYLF